MKAIAPSLEQIGLLLFIATLVAILSRRLRLPYTAGLVLAGMGLTLLNVRMHVHLSKDLIFSVFLPPLIFEAALCISWRQFKREIPVVGLLATLGVVLATAVTAAGMCVVLDWDWRSALVFGVLIAATDPVSVIATFKEAGVQGRLRLLLESESLLNDGTAAVGFVTVLSLIAGQQHSVWSIAGALALTVGGGALIGAVIGFGLMLLAGRTSDHLVEITLTTLAAYGSFFAAEHYHASGVLAALTAGLIIGNYRSAARISDSGRHALETFWEYAAFLANSLIFILIGVQEAEQHFGGLWLPVLVAIVFVTAGRAVAIYPVCALFAKTALKVPLRQQHVMVWGGVRGALALALALALPDDLAQRDAIITITFAVVAFSIFAQGMTMTPLLRGLGELQSRAKHR